MTNQIVPGSLSALSQQSGKSLAESFISADVVVIVDTSGSMGGRDSRGGQSRYDVACEELAGLQAHLPGKIAVVGFSSHTEFCPNGLPPFLMGGTDVAGALRFVKCADVPDMRFILISDGEPDDAQEALRIAGTYRNRIDTIFVGSEDSHSGREFLAKLSSMTGGKSVKAAAGVELEANIMQLLGSGK